MVKSSKIFKGFAVGIIIAVMIAVSACATWVPEAHTHTFESEWTFDEEGHWHSASCNHKDVRSDYAAHSWDAGNVIKEPTASEEGQIVFTCTICKYTRTENLEPHEHTFSLTWSYDEESHWHSATCGHEAKSEMALHAWDLGTLVTPPTEEVEGVVKYTCTVCGYEREENIGLLVSQITVQFLDYDGSIFDAQVLDVDPERGASAVRPQDPTRGNYRFIGWDGPLEGLWADTVLHAVYLRQYTVFFFDYDGDILKECVVDEGGDAEPPQEPTREGYTFSGWNGTYSNVTEDEQVVAEYNMNVYKVKFYMPNGSLIEEQNVKYGFMPQEPTVKDVYIDWRKSKGYRFTGWGKPIAAATAECEYHAQYLDEIIEPILAVDAEAYKQIQGGADATKEFNIGIYLLGNLSIYGLNLEIGYDVDLSLNDAAVVPGQSFAGTQLGSRVDTFKRSCNFTWTGSSSALSVSERVQILALHFHFPESRPKIGDHNITIEQSSYIINEKLEKVKPVIVSDCITVI